MLAFPLMDILSSPVHRWCIHGDILGGLHVLHRRWDLCAGCPTFSPEGPSALSNWAIKTTTSQLFSSRIAITTLNSAFARVAFRCSLSVSFSSSAPLCLDLLSPPWLHPSALKASRPLRTPYRSPHLPPTLKSSPLSRLSYPRLMTAPPPLPLHPPLSPLQLSKLPPLLRTRLRFLSQLLPTR